MPTAFVVKERVPSLRVRGRSRAAVSLLSHPETLLVEKLPVTNRCVMRRPDELVPELRVELRRLELVSIDDDRLASSSSRLTFGGREEPSTQPPATQALVNPEVFDAGIAAPGEAVESGDESAALVAQEAAKRSPIAVTGPVRVSS
jgi:hypothetical protein